MAFISIDVEEIGATGLTWLFLTYGFVLYQASNLISEGSDLLLLVPSLAGLVGGVVLPLLGAVPDGAIMLFSGLGDLDAAQANLSVGVGALAGSSIMLLTVSLGLSVFAGRVDYSPEDNMPNYFGKPKLDARKTFSESLTTTGVVINPEVNSGAKIMMLTTISYLIIQVPASYLTEGGWKEVGREEKYYALTGLIVCVIAFVSYLVLQYRMASDGQNFDKMVFEMKKSIEDGTISLRACLFEFFEARSQAISTRTLVLDGESEEQALLVKKFDHKAFPLMKSLLQTPFHRYDYDRSGTLDKSEIKAVFLDLNEKRNDDFVDEMLENFDRNKDGLFSFDEFAVAAFATLKREFESGEFTRGHYMEEAPRPQEASGDDDEGEEEEEIPDEFLDLSPTEQQAAIKKRAFTMLFIGTVLVVLFSDPMVDVIGEIAVRIHVSSFYVSFALVPLASNASEVIASQFYAKKKTSKTITVSLSALEGAAAMNNTFGLAIFLGLIYFRGLAWEFTAETITIVGVQVIVGISLLFSKMSYLTGYFIIALFPLSIALVAILEAYGLD